MSSKGHQASWIELAIYTTFALQASKNECLAYFLLLFFLSLLFFYIGEGI
jgi:hypothetical protein